MNLLRCPDKWPLVDPLQCPKQVSNGSPNSPASSSTTANPDSVCHESASANPPAIESAPHHPASPPAKRKTRGNASAGSYIQDTGHSHPQSKVHALRERPPSAYVR